MMKFGLMMLALLFCSAPRYAEITVIKAGKLYDPNTSTILADQLITIENGRIKSVTRGGSVPPGATVIDLSNRFVLPGMIDCHTHVLLQPEDEGEVPPVITKSQAFRTIQGVAAARKDLEAGFTTMRDLDSEGAGFADVSLRDAIEKGIVPGPRLLVSTFALTITAGHMNLTGMNPDLTLPDPAALTDTREAMISEVRRQVKYGADWIKLYSTGTLRHLDPITLEPVNQVSVEDVEAIVTEAKRWKRDVAAHAYGGEGAKNSILGGVRSIEHGMLLDDEVIRLMKQRGTFYCPTLTTYIAAGKIEPSEKLKKVIERHKESFRKAMQAGVKIAFGTDVGAFEHGTSAGEFKLMVDYGMKPAQAIHSATLRAAELLRMENQIGSIEAGKFADIIAVNQNPLEDITALQRVVFVMKQGKVYKQQ